MPTPGLCRCGTVSEFELAESCRHNHRSFERHEHGGTAAGDRGFRIGRAGWMTPNTNGKRSPAKRRRARREASASPGLRANLPFAVVCPDATTKVRVEGFGAAPASDEGDRHQSVDKGLPENAI